MKHRRTASRSRCVTQTTVRQMAARIVDEFAPQQVILFGSHARNRATRDSDVDLLVVMPIRGSKRELRIRIGVALAEFGVPMDIVVSTPEELSLRKDIPGTIESPATKEGKVLYARSR